MRRQELIYNQNNNFVRNRDLLNISTSTDMCIFESPIFNMSGATKLMSGMTSGNTGIHIVKDNEEFINLTFNFVNNLTSLEVDSIFNYNVYKFDDKSSVFKEPPIFTSVGREYSTFNVSEILNETIPMINLLDGEYLIKGNYNYKVCTYILGQLGLRNTTNSMTPNGEFYLYNDVYDYYFAAIQVARIPLFSYTPDTEIQLNSLNSITIFPSGETSFFVENIKGSPIVTLNGLILARYEDYDISGSTINLFAPTISEDIINIIFVASSSQNGLVGKSYSINTPIVSGGTNFQGKNLIYYNTVFNKYEIYTETDPIDGNEVIISINGVVLANKIDYVQSITNKRRFILYGNLFIGDVITIIYNGNATYVGSITDNSLTIYWTIDTAPQKNNGIFVLEVSKSENMLNIISSATTSYVVGDKVYNASVNINATPGTVVFYRVKNIKKYITILGDVIESTASTEIISLRIMTNSSNNY